MNLISSKRLLPDFHRLHEFKKNSEEEIAQGSGGYC